MAAHTVSRGLDLPIAGPPAQVIHSARGVRNVAVLPADLLGFRPRLAVQVGDTVSVGQVLYQDRTHDALRVVAPASGKVTHVHRGDRRLMLSVVLAIDESAERPSAAGSSAFASWSRNVAGDRAALRALLQECGLWTALRTRPFSHVPLPDAEPQALFVTAMDTQPLAPSVDVIIAERADDFAAGLEALVALIDAPVHVCRHAGSNAGDGVRGVRITDFSGKHPAGTVGYHIHMLSPVSREHSVWHLSAQDVIRIGHVVRTGTLDVSQIVALGGPLVREPRLLRTQLGASVTELLEGELTDGEGAVSATGVASATRRADAVRADVRVLSGSVLTGTQVADTVIGYLGRFHQQISVIPEDPRSDFLGWVSPFTSSFSHLPVYISAWVRNGRRAFDTRLHGGQRAMVPIGAYERVMPMDIMPTHLLRAITIGDAAWAEQLGALELDEEDVALCSFVCPGKYDYGPALRRVLDQISGEQ